jgi:hypothetical protein
MSNVRLVLILSTALLFFVAVALHDFFAYGSYGGFGAVFWFVPIVFILSMMFAIACGLRGPKK